MGVRPSCAYIQKFQVARRRRPRRIVSIPAVETLEERRLLATVYWTSSTNGDWSTPGNWSTDTVPGPDDDVVINESGATPTVTIGEGETESVHSITAADPLSLLGGSLTVTGTPPGGGPSTISGSIDIEGGTLIASGQSASLTAKGSVTANYGTVLAEAGASFSLPGLTSFDGDGMTFGADGTGSTLDITGITSFVGNNTTISETNSGHVAMDTSFTTLDGVSFTIDGTSDLATGLIGNLTALTDGGLDVVGGTYSFPSLALIDGSSLQVSNGASLTLGGVASYSYSPGNGHYAAGNGPAFVATDTTSGGTIDLPLLATIGGNSGVQVEAAGAQSTIELPVLTSFSALYSFAELGVTQSATIDEPNLTSLNGVIVKLDGSGKIAVSQWTTYNDGSLSDEGGNYSPQSGTANATNAFTNLTNVDGSSLYVSGGGSLTLPEVQTYNPGFRDGAFNASGTGAVLNLPELGSVSRPSTGSSGSHYGSYTNSGYFARNRFNFVASGGGTVNAPSLAAINVNATELSIGAQVQGAGSLVDLSGLTTFASYNALLSATQGGELLLNPGLTSLESTRFILDGSGGGIVTPTDSSSLDQFTSLNYDYINIEGGTYVLPNLTDIDNAGIAVSGGGSLTLPGVTSWQNNAYSTGISVSVGDTTNGGTLDLPYLTTLGGTYGFNLFAAGSSSVLDVPALTELGSPLNYYATPSSLTVLLGATVDDSSLTHLKGVKVKIGGAVKLATRQWTSLTDGELSILGVNYPSPTTETSTASFANLSDIRGSGIFVSDGILTLPGVTSDNPRNTQGTLLNLEASGSGAVLSLPNLTSVTGSYSSNGGGSGSIGGESYYSSNGNLDFEAKAGGQVRAEKLSSITAGAQYLSVGAISIGTNSLVDLSGLTTYESEGGSVKANGGGTVDLSALTTIGGDYGVRIVATGKQSEINLPSLTSLSSYYSSRYYTYTSLSVTDYGEVNAANLTTLTGVTVKLDGTGKLAIKQWQSLTNGDLSIIGGDYAPSNPTSNSSRAFSGLGTIDGSGIYVSGGGSLSLTGVTTAADVLLQSYHSGSAAGASTVGSLILTRLETLTGDSLQILSRGKGSKIELAKLTSISLSNPSDGTLSVTNQGDMVAPVLTSLSGVDVILDGTGTIDTTKWTTVTQGRLAITGGNYVPTGAQPNGPFGSLTNIDGSGLVVSGGGSLTLPEVTSFQPLNDVYFDGFNGPVFEATGTGSVLNLPALAEISESGVAYYYTPMIIEAAAGGKVSLPALLTIDTSGFDAPVSIEADGSGSEVDVSAMTTYAQGMTVAIIAATNGGKIDLNKALTSLSYVNLELDGTGSLPVGQFTSITDGDITVLGGDYATGTPLANVADIDGSSVYVYGGGKLSLPGVTEYTSDYNTLQTDGTSSTYPYPTTVGTLDLGSLETITGYVYINASGEGSEIDLSSLKSLTGGSLSVTNQGKVDDPVLTSLSQEFVTLDGTGVIAVSKWQSLTDSTLYISGGDYTSAFISLNDIDDSSLFVYGGGSLALSSVTHYDGSYGTFRAYQPTYYGYGTLSPGSLSLANLTAITGSVNIQAAGLGSAIDLSGITALGGGSISVTQQGSVLADSLKTLAYVSVTLDGTGTLATSQWTSFTDGTLYISAGDYSSTTSPPFGGLSDIDYSNIYVYGGGRLSLPSVTSYASGYNALNGLQPSYYSGTPSTGTLLLPALTSITGVVYVNAIGPGSEVDISKVASLGGGNLTVTKQGTVLDNALTSLTGVTVTLDGTGTVGTSQWTTLTNSQLYIEAGDYRSSFMALADIDGTSLQVYGGGVSRVARGHHLRELLQYLQCLSVRLQRLHGRNDLTTRPHDDHRQWPVDHRPRTGQRGGHGGALDLERTREQPVGHQPRCCPGQWPGDSQPDDRYARRHGYDSDGALDQLHEQPAGDRGWPVHVQPASRPRRIIDQHYQRRRGDIDGAHELCQCQRL